MNQIKYKKMGSRSIRFYYFFPTPALEVLRPVMKLVPKTPYSLVSTWTVELGYPIYLL